MSWRHACAAAIALAALSGCTSARQAGNPAPVTTSTASVGTTSIPDEPTSSSGAQVTQGSLTGSATSRPGSSTPADPTDPLKDAKVRDFVTKCQHTLDNWTEAQLNWPAEMHLSLGQAVTYQVVADARSVPAPAATVIGGTNPTSTSVTVECILAARLVAVDDAVGVGVVGAQDDGWIYRKFGASGQLSWSWTVTARDLGAHQLKVQLQPVAASGGVPGVRADLFERTTSVDIEGDVVQRTANWFTQERGYLYAIGTGVLAALLWMLGAFGQVRKAFTELRGKGAPDEAGEQPKPPPVTEQPSGDTSVAVKKRSRKR